MKNKWLAYPKIYLMAILIFIAIIGIGAFFSTDATWVIITGAVLAITAYIIIHLERKKFERNLVTTSEIIRSMIDGESTPVIPENADILMSKIQHQLDRLQAMVQTCEEKTKKDKEEISRLITEIAHQLRTPLSNMELYIDLLKNGNEWEQNLYAIEASEKKLIFLIESFIKISRLEHKIIQIKKEDTDITKTILSSILQVQKPANAKDIKIKFNGDSRIFIAHDKNWIGEAVFNLLDNSVKYSKDGSSIEISLTQNEMFTQIAVRDYGIGIKNGEENDIFKRFYRGKNVSSQEGFGIGLYVAREIVAKHNGFLKVKREDFGTSFSIYLPM